MPVDGVTAEQIQAQVAAEVAYHTADAGIVSSLALIKNPTLVITSSNDLTNPPSNEASRRSQRPKHVEMICLATGKSWIYPRFVETVRLS